MVELQIAPVVTDDYSDLSVANGPLQDTLRTPEQDQNQKVVFVGTTHFPKWIPQEKRGLPSSLTSADQALQISDNARGDSALESLRVLRDKGYRVVIVDGDPDEGFGEFRHYMRNMGIRVEEEDPDKKKRSLTAAKRKGYEIAMQMPGAEFIATSEVEKSIDWDSLLEPLRSGDADINIPHRGSLEDYPEEQRKLELQTNDELNKAARDAGWLRENESFDWTNGTRVWRNTPELNEMFTRAHELTGQLRQSYLVNPKPGPHGEEKRDQTNPNRWYDTLYGPLVEAFYRRWLSRQKDEKEFPKIQTIAINYKHHESTIEEGNPHFAYKRELQYRNIVPLFESHVRYLMAPHRATKLVGSAWSALIALKQANSPINDQTLEEYYERHPVGVTIADTKSEIMPKN